MPQPAERRPRLLSAVPYSPTVPGQERLAMLESLTEDFTAEEYSVFLGYLVVHLVNVASLRDWDIAMINAVERSEAWQRSRRAAGDRADPNEPLL